MRVLFTLLLALSLGACVQREGPTRPAAGDAACARVATHDVTWSSQDVDTVTARSEGPTCAQAVVTLVVRNAHGDPLWSFANTYYDLHTGGTPPPGVTPSLVSTDDMERFLQSFADLTQMHSAQLPAWAEGAAGPADASRPFHYATTYARDAYEAMRTSNRPLICYAAAADATQCLIIDPVSNAPAMIVAFGP